MTQPNAGVYALIHTATKQVYIGSSKNLKHRRAQWWQRMNTDHQNLPPAMRSITASRKDWVFKLLWDGSGATAEQLQQMEAKAVEILRLGLGQGADRVINSLPVQRPDNVGLTAGGRTMSLNAWSRETGIPRATIAIRANQLGWTPEQAVGLEPKPFRDYPAIGKRGMNREHSLSMMPTVIVDDSGQPMLVSEACRILGCTRETLSGRLQRRRVRYGETEVTLADLKTGSDKFRLSQL